MRHMLVKPRFPYLVMRPADSTTDRTCRYRYDTSRKSNDIDINEPDAQLEVKLRAEFHQPPDQNRRGRLPRRTVSGVHGEDWTRVEQIIQIEHSPNSGPTDIENLA